MEDERLKELREGDDILTVGGHLPQEPPLWLDMKKWNRARELYTKYFAAINFGHLCGLLLSFYFSKNIRTLKSTGHSNSTEALFRRYLATIRHIQSWYEGDVWDPHDSGRRSLAMVRSMHSRAALKMAKLKDGTTYVSQWDMTVTQWAFIGPIVLFPFKLGMHGCSEEDLDALVHFWRGIGYLLGIDEKFNLCSGSLSHVVNTCYTLMEKEYKVKVSEADVSSVTMCQDVMKALKKIDPMLSWKLMSTYIHRMINVPCFEEMGLIDRIIYWFICFTAIYGTRIAFLRTLLNLFTRWKFDKAEAKNFMKREDDAKLLAHAYSG